MESERKDCGKRERGRMLTQDADQQTATLPSIPACWTHSALPAANARCDFYLVSRKGPFGQLHLDGGSGSSGRRSATQYCDAVRAVTC